MNTDPSDEWLAELLAQQSDDSPSARPIAAARMIAIAADPGQMTGAEMASLMLSPSLRAEFAAARAAPANDNMVFRLITMAASDGADVPLEFVIDDVARLSLRRGPVPSLPFLLALALDPSLPGGPTGRRVRLREEGVGFVWLEATSDAQGIAHAPWRHGDVTPHQRLQAGARLRLEFLDPP